MTPDKILNYCLNTLEGTVLVSSWGERGIFYNPGGKLKRGVYVLTVKEKDGENDKSSRLSREGVYRVSLGLRPETFLRLFDPSPRTFETLKPLIEESYEYAREKYAKRAK